MIIGETFQTKFNIPLMIYPEFTFVFVKQYILFVPYTIKFVALKEISNEK